MEHIDKNICLANFGSFIQSGRRKMDLTQAEAAEMIGITQQYISLLERGERDISFSDALDICKVLNLDMRDFIGTYM